MKDADVSLEAVNNINTIMIEETRTSNVPKLPPIGDRERITPSGLRKLQKHLASVQENVANNEQNS